MTRYHYVPEDEKCEKFYYSGCDGNGNNFQTKKECYKVCCTALHCTVLYCTVQVCYSEEEDLSIKSFFDLFTLSSDNTGTGATEDYYGHYGSGRVHQIVFKAFQKY